MGRLFRGMRGSRFVGVKPLGLLRIRVVKGGRGNRSCGRSKLFRINAELAAGKVGAESGWVDGEDLFFALEPRVRIGWLA